MDTEDVNSQVTQIESLCMNCRQNGTTKMMLTVIPHFKEVIIASFECPHCGYSNREVESGAKLADRGVHYELKVTKQNDLNRKVIKSDTCTAFLPELEFEIPPNTQKGVCNTLEGILMDAADGLEIGQEHRKQEAIEIAMKLEEVIFRLRAYAAGEQLPFTFILDDPSGNSYIEFDGIIPARDESLKKTNYQRTKEQLHAMGFYEESAQENNNELEQSPKTVEATASVQQLSSPTANIKTAFSHGVELGKKLPAQLKASGWDFSFNIEDNIERIEKERTQQQQKQQSDDGGIASSVENTEPEGIVFNVECPNCGKQGMNEMCPIDIPGFRRCMIMAFNCLNCGSRSNEVKALGAYGDKAKRWTLTVETSDDLNRDILKSDTASVLIPELDFEMCMGTLGGVFTTIEGLILKVVEHLENTGDMVSGDSADLQQKKLFYDVIEKLKSLAIEPSSLPFTLIVDDPADLSMISERFPEHRITGMTKQGENRSTEVTQDLNLKVELYERTKEQNDELGLTDMKVENYEE